MVANFPQFDLPGRRFVLDPFDEVRKCVGADVLQRVLGASASPGRGEHPLGQELALIARLGIGPQEHAETDHDSGEQEPNDPAGFHWNSLTGECLESCRFQSKNFGDA